MRRITLLLASILTVCSLNAQKGNKNEKVVNIDKVNYRITYNSCMELLWYLACNSDLAISIICVTFASEILNNKRL